MNANLYAILRGHFPANSNQPCLLIPDGPVIHYDGLDEMSARMANALLGAGARPGDRIAVQVEKCWEALALYLACVRAGFVFLPLNTGYIKNEVGYVFSDAEPSVIVCGPDSVDRIAPLRPQAEVLTLASERGTLLDRASRCKPHHEIAMSKPDDLVAILYTSGTTGRPKGAMLTHRNLASNALTLVDCWGFTGDDVLLHALPIFHVHGLFVACHCALLAGARMLWLAKFDPAEVRAQLPRASVMMGVPTFYRRLLGEAAFGERDCSSMRLFISGSAPLLPETFEEFKARTGHTILERYGMTETGMLTSNPLVGDRIAGSVGPPLPHVSLRVTGPDGQLLGPDQVGSIEVKGPNVFCGYWGMPEKTREEFTADGYFRTGDLGALLPNGYVHLSGRAKDLIITGGLNVYPLEIEEKIDALPDVLESAVIGVPDHDFGEAVTAVVVVKPGHRISERGMIATLKTEIAGFKVPKRVHFVNELPRNTMGKVQKNILRDRFSSPP